MAVRTKESAERYVQKVCRDYPYLLNLAEALEVAQKYDLGPALVKELAIRVLTEAMCASVDIRFKGHQYWVEYAQKVMQDFNFSDEEIVEAGTRALEKEIRSEQIVIVELREFVRWRIGQLQCTYNLSRACLPEAALRAARAVGGKSTNFMSAAENIITKYGVAQEALQGGGPGAKSTFNLPPY